jgi:hypothetical protein
MSSCRAGLEFASTEAWGIFGLALELKTTFFRVLLARRGTFSLLTDLLFSRLIAEYVTGMELMAAVSGTRAAILVPPLLCSKR